MLYLHHSLLIFVFRYNFFFELIMHMNGILAFIFFPTYDKFLFNNQKVKREK